MNNDDLAKLKVTAKQSKVDFELHVRMLQRRGLSKAEATCVAYAQGHKFLIGLFSKQEGKNDATS